MKIWQSNVDHALQGGDAAAGMTLIEVVMALLISSIAVSCMVSGYVFSINSAEKSALSLAATAQAVERVEETRAARYDIRTIGGDELQASNFVKKIVPLDVAGSGSNITYATNNTYIFQISTNPPLKGIRVECVWRFQNSLITNSVETVRFPD